MTKSAPTPVIVMPMRDPEKRLFSHLSTTVPKLKQIFSRAIVSVPTSELAALPPDSAALLDDPFFSVVELPPGMKVGEEFRRLYEVAITSCCAEQILHLCFLDRVAYALESEHCHAFVGDLARIEPDAVPILFQRSATAWQTHPRNYREIEGMVTAASELLFGRSLDFAWCHITLSARQLGVTLERTQRTDFILLAELIVHMIDVIQTRNVDWLAWEDPFVFGRDAQDLKIEREASRAETQKRFGYVIPMLELLLSADSS